MTPTLHHTFVSYATTAAALPRKITYSVSVFSLEQMGMKRLSRSPPANDIIILDDNEPWDTLQAQILEKISVAINPSTLNFADYRITFTVPRQVMTPLPLNSLKYPYLVENALISKMKASAKVLVEPITTSVGKENDQDRKGKSGSGRKTKVPNEQQILPRNLAVVTKIGALRAKWICPMPGGPCGSTHCFVHPTDQEHFPLGHAHIEAWAMAMHKGPEYATIDKPPNHHLFNKLSPVTLAAQSPLLQRRLELKEKANTSMVLQVNINLPPDLLSFMRPPTATAAPDNSTPTLIPPSKLAGPNMTIQAFCATYHLDDEIRDLFLQHRFKSTDAFAYTELSELKGMGFKVGEIAELKAAINSWVVIRTD
ncbi:hypothetical protein C8J57DRAFT_1069506 [Mycena rebaudengoi]|nr:hypothetical protein C8J57DRAFT_1069506 [Mycena rebaudengoi]